MWKSCRLSPVTNLPCLSCTLTGTETRFVSTRTMSPSPTSSAVGSTALSLGWTGVNGVALPVESTRAGLRPDVVLPGAVELDRFPVRGLRGRAFGSADGCAGGSLAVFGGSLAVFGGLLAVLEGAAVLSPTIK